MRNYFFHMFSQSSFIQYAEYDRGTLMIRFHQGDVYHYYNVPLQVAVSLIAAPSAGTYYNAHIKTQFALPRATPSGSTPLRPTEGRRYAPTAQDRGAE